MRVGLFTNNYLPFRGGVTTSVETLRRGLDASGHEAWVVAPRFPGAGADAERVLRYPSVPALTYPDFAVAVPFAPGVTGRVRALRLDLFHAHHPFLLGPAARRLARGQGKPLIFTYHTRYDKYAHYVPVWRSLGERLAIGLSTAFAARADAVVAPSALVRDELRRRGVRAPIAVVPTGVDLDRFSPGDKAAARRALGLPAADPILLYAGRLDREKSVDRVVLAFERAASIVPGARLVLVGHGTQAAPLRRLAGRLATGGRIHFLGVRPHDEMPACYRAADLFLFASQTETQGLVLVEAAACGLPAVAVTAPGCDEVVVDGRSGLLTKAEPAALADAAIGLLLDRERRQAMGCRAREIAVRDFDVRLQIERMLAVYADAVGRRGA